MFAITFAIGAGLAGLGGVIGAVELSMVPGEDTRLLLASLIVVIVGGMGSVVGAAIGAVILGLAETFGLAYAPTYSVVFTFVILVIVLAFRPRGLMGGPHEREPPKHERHVGGAARSDEREVARGAGMIAHRGRGFAWSSPPPVDHRAASTTTSTRGAQLVLDGFDGRWLRMRRACRGLLSCSRSSHRRSSRSRSARRRWHSD